MSSQYATTRGVGQYRASETHVGIFDRMYRGDGTRMGVIFLHGASLLADDWVNDNQADKIRAFAAAGYPVISADLAGAAWCNDAHLAAITDAYNYLIGTLGAKTGKVLLYGSSMGGAGALAWADANATLVQAVACAVPTLDINAVYQTPGTLRTQIEAAYGITYPTALPVNRSAVAMGASDLAGIPVRVWTSSNDTTGSNTAIAQAWNGAGSTYTVTDLGAVGHSAAAVVGQDVLQWFDNQGGRL